MRKINHLIMNTGEVLHYENNLESASGFREVFGKIDWQVKTWQNIPVSDRTEMGCLIGKEYKAYRAVLYSKEAERIPLLTTIGVVDVDAVNTETVEIMWDLVTDIYSPLCNVSVIPGIPATSAVYGKYPETPFICDVLYPYMRYLAPDVLEWNRGFTKYLGIEMLKELSQEEEDMDRKPDQQHL